jgi:LysM repeat protein
MVFVVYLNRRLAMSQQVDRKPSREWFKFGILAVVLFVTILVVAALRPFIFEHVVPVVLGERQLFAPMPVIIDEPAKPEVEAEAYPVEAPSVEAPSIEAYPVEEVSEEAYPVEENQSEGEGVEGTGETAGGDSATSEEESVALPTAVSTITYVVLPGETIIQIAERYNVTVDEIVAANNILDPNFVTAGMTLLIPKPEG